MRCEIILSSLQVCKWFLIWNEKEGKPYLVPPKKALLKRHSI